MGVDATVMCNCFREGRTTDPPVPREWLVLDAEGYLSLRPSASHTILTSRSMNGSRIAARTLEWITPASGLRTGQAIGCSKKPWLP